MLVTKEHGIFCFQ